MAAKRKSAKRKSKRKGLVVSRNDYCVLPGMQERVSLGSRSAITLVNHGTTPVYVAFGRPPAR